MYPVSSLKGRLPENPGRVLTACEQVRLKRDARGTIRSEIHEIVFLKRFSITIRLQKYMYCLILYRTELIKDDTEKPQYYEICNMFECILHIYTDMQICKYLTAARQSCLSNNLGDPTCQKLILSVLR